MAKTKTAATKTKRARTGTKTTARRAAGKTAKKALPGAVTDARGAGAKTLARIIAARNERRPTFWSEVQLEVSRLFTPPTRVSQVEPREHATH